MRVRSATATLAFALTASAADPAQLEAQRRVPAGVVRQSRSPAPRSCLAQKVLHVAGSTALGYVMGYLLIAILWPTSEARGSAAEDARNIAKLGAIGGFVRGVRHAITTPCAS
jgi:hypothetical protein